MSYKRCQDLEGTVPLSTRPTWSGWTSGTTSSSATWAGGALTNPSNSSSYWPPRQLFHLLQSGDSFTSCSLLDSVSTPLEAIWQRGALSPWPFSHCATGKQWQTWFHSLTKSNFTWAFEQKALKLSERVGGELGWTARWLARLIVILKVEVFVMTISINLVVTVTIFKTIFRAIFAKMHFLKFIEYSRSLTFSIFSPL